MGFQHNPQASFPFLRPFSFKTNWIFRNITVTSREQSWFIFRLVHVRRLFHWSCLSFIFVLCFSLSFIHTSVLSVSCQFFNPLLPFCLVSNNFPLCGKTVTIIALPCIVMFEAGSIEINIKSAGTSWPESKSYAKYVVLCAWDEDEACGVYSENVFIKQKYFRFPKFSWWSIDFTSVCISYSKEFLI